MSEPDPYEALTDLDRQTRRVGSIIGWVAIFAAVLLVYTISSSWMG